MNRIQIVIFLLVMAVLELMLCVYMVGYNSGMNDASVIADKIATGRVDDMQRGFQESYDNLTAAYAKCIKTKANISHRIRR